jgi:chromosomal replication initiator protein
MKQTMTKASETDWPTIWAAARERMRRDLGDAVFDAWISSLSLVEFANGEIKIGAPRPFRAQLGRQPICRAHRARAARRRRRAGVALDRARARESGVRLSRRKRRRNRIRMPLRCPRACMRRRTRQTRRTAPRAQQPHARPDADLRDFVSGPSNEFGFRAARAVAEGDESDVSLLYIHGGFGNGKTHLLNAIALEAKQARPSRACISARKISCASSWAR